MALKYQGYTMPGIVPTAREQEQEQECSPDYITTTIIYNQNMNLQD